MKQLVQAFLSSKWQGLDSNPPLPDSQALDGEVVPPQVKRTSRRPGIFVENCGSHGFCLTTKVVLLYS